MDLFDFPDDYKPQKKLTDQEADQITNYLKGHPLFLKQIPQDISTNPDLAALKSIMDQDPVTQAQNLNKNANARLKQGPNSPYYMKNAYAKYTAAINLNCNDNILNSKIHCNRAAINLKLKNYGKVVEDCKKSLAYDPKYAKAYYRLSKAYIALHKYSECIDLLKDQTQPQLKALRQEANTLLEKQKSQNQKVQQKQKIFSDKIHTYFQQRKWKLGKRNEQLPEGIKIQFIDDKISIPLIVAYPEFSQFDLIATTFENRKIGDCLKQLFTNPLPWDSKGQYLYTSLQIFSQVEQGVLLKLPKQVTVGQLASRLVVKGAIEVIVLSNNTFSQHFKSQYKIL